MIPLTCEHLPCGALPIYEFDVPQNVWLIQEDGSYERRTIQKKVVIPEYEVFAPTAEELHRNLVTKLLELAFISNYEKGIIQIAVREDVILYGDGKTHFIKLGSMFVPNFRKDHPLLVYRSTATDRYFPENINMDDLDEDAKNMLTIEYVMDS